MKGLKKLALATAVAAAPFAQAELTAMDDSLLEEMTGQSGISIELSAQATIGAIEYTDTDQNGTIGINNIAFGGATVVDGSLGNEMFDDIKIDIDVDETEGLTIHLGGTNPLTAITGDNPVDFGLTVGDVTLNSALTLASGIEIQGNLGPVDIDISNAGVIDVDAYFEVTAGEMDIDVLGMGITNLKIGQDSNPMAGGDYATDLANVQAGAVAQNAAIIAGGGDTAADAYAVSEGFADDADLQANGDATQIATAAANRSAGEAAATAQVEAAAISGVSNMAYVGMTIQAVSTAYVDGTGTAHTIDNALQVGIDSMSMDISMDVSLGNEGGTALALGGVTIDDLNLSGTTLKIYGH